MKFEVNVRRSFLLIFASLLLLGIGIVAVQAFSSGAFDKTKEQAANFGHSSDEVVIDVAGTKMTLQSAINAGVLGPSGSNPVTPTPTPATDNSGSHMFTAVFGFDMTGQADPRIYCPEGWNFATFDEISGADTSDWISIHQTRSSFFIGPSTFTEADSNYAYAQMHKSQKITHFCWKSFPKKQYVSFIQISKDSVACPTDLGYRAIPSSAIVGWNDYGYLQLHEGGFYVGGLYTWLITNYGESSKSGWQRRTWTESNMNKLCWKIYDDTTQHYPVVIGTQDGTICPAGYKVTPMKDFQRSDGWFHLSWSDVGMIMGGTYDWNYGGDNYASIHVHETHVPGTGDAVCWNVLSTQGEPRLTFRPTDLACSALGSGFSALNDISKLTRWDGGTHVQGTSYGLFMGTLYSWQSYGGYSTTSFKWYSATGNKVARNICYKLENAL